MYAYLRGGHGGSVSQIIKGQTKRNKNAPKIFVPQNTITLPAISIKWCGPATFKLHSPQKLFACFTPDTTKPQKVKV